MMDTLTTLAAACLACAAAFAGHAPPRTPPGEVPPHEAEALFAGVLGSTPALRGLAAEPERYRLQILFGEVTPGADGRPGLRRAAFRPDAEYWYPASTVKIFAAAAALDALGPIAAAHPGAGVSPDTPLVYHPLFEGEALERDDPSNTRGGVLTLRTEIRKTLIVSDNEAFNKLYEFAGPAALNRVSHTAGLPSVRVSHRLAESRTAEENRACPRIDLVTHGGLVTLPRRRDPGSFGPGPAWRDGSGPDLALGRAYAAGGRVVEGPFPMGHRNAVSLRDLQNITAMIARPDLDLGLPGLSLAPAHLALLRDAMTDDPSASGSPRFDTEAFSDDWPHFFMPGLTRVVPRHELLVTNKIGLAYGFSSETAYVEHLPTGRAFLLAMTLYTNDNATLNDGVYEYDWAHAAMADAAEAFARRVFERDAPAGSVAAPSPWAHERTTLLDATTEPVVLRPGEAWHAAPVASPGFVELIASWNADTPPGAGLRFEVRCRAPGGPWSAWLPIGVAGGASAEPEPWPTSDRVARVEVDTLVPAAPAEAWQLRALARGSAASTLRRVDAVATTEPAARRRVADERRAGRVEAPTPIRPNDIADESLRSRLCSPLSLRMLLAARGVEVPIDAMAREVYDDRFDIYGNWPNAIAAAHDRGVPGYLHRFADWAEVREHLAAVGPIAISIRFAEGELPDAPYDSTQGHLIVVYGLDEHGDALVLDPALSPESEARRVYDRDALSRVWLDRVKGLAYAVLDSDARSGGTP